MCPFLLTIKKVMIIFYIQSTVVELLYLNNCTSYAQNR